MPATRAELRRCRGPRLPVGTAALSRETKSLQITTSSTWDPRAAVSAVAPFEAFDLKAIDGWGDRAPEEWLRSGLSLACSLAAGDAQRRPRAQDRSERYSNPERAFLTCAPFPLGAEQSPCEDVRKPRYKVKVRAFTAEEVSQLAEEANELSALLIRVAASTGLRFGEARRSQVERHRPRVRIAQGARALHARRVVRSKDANSRRVHPVGTRSREAVEAAPTAPARRTRVPESLWRTDRLSQLACALLGAAPRADRDHRDFPHIAALLRDCTHSVRRECEGRADFGGPSLSSLRARSVRRRCSAAARGRRREGGERASTGKW